MASSENPMAYLLEHGLRRVETERPELANDSRYLELKEQLLRDAEGHFREIQATYATILKTQCHCGGQLEPVDHEFGKSGAGLPVSKGGIHLGGSIGDGFEGLSSSHVRH
jgi:hypothetical protein